MVERIIERLRNPETPTREFLFQPTLVVRESVGPCADSGRVDGKALSSRDKLRAEPARARPQPSRAGIEYGDSPE